jgi:hypothetical protein
MSDPPWGRLFHSHLLSFEQFAVRQNTCNGFFQRFRPGFVSFSQVLGAKLSQTVSKTGVGFCS